jgi:hypothetical protein
MRRLLADVSSIVSAVNLPWHATCASPAAKKLSCHILKSGLGDTKRFADVASLPPDFEIAPEWDLCIASIMRPAAQERIKKLLDQGFHQLGEVEQRLGYHVGELRR